MRMRFHSIQRNISMRYVDRDSDREGGREIGAGKKERKVKNPLLTEF